MKKRFFDLLGSRCGTRCPVVPTKSIGSTSCQYDCEYNEGKTFDSELQYDDRYKKKVTKLYVNCKGDL